MVDKKESYQRTELSIIRFTTEDVITTSNPSTPQIEGEMD